MDDVSLARKIDVIYNKLGDKSAAEEDYKKFKLPFKAKLGAAKLRKGWVTVLYLNANKNISFGKYIIKDGVVKVNGLYYEAAAENIMIYKNKPFLILPEWNEKPVAPNTIKNPYKSFSPSENFKEASENKTLTMGQRYILNAFETDAIKPKMKLSGSLILWIIIIAAAGYFILKKYGGLG